MHRWKIWTGGILGTMGLIFLTGIFWPVKISEPTRWTFYDRGGAVLFSEKSSGETSPQIPKRLEETLLASEDQNFWHHSGVDFMALGRAAWGNLKNQKVQSGASTLTMQLARMLFLEGLKHDASYKIQQIWYAWRLEAHFSKREILQMYARRVYLGQGATGFDDASYKYFSKPLASLSTPEIATLVGIIPRPDTWNPIASPQIAEMKKNEVLRRLLVQKKITKSEYDFFVAEKIKLAPGRPPEIHAPHFVFWAKEKLRTVCKNSAECHVYTTLDKIWYQKTRDLVQGKIAKAEGKNLSNAATIVLELPGNELRVMLGSTDFFEEKIDGSVNMATAKREVGSTLKPFLYALALESGFTPLNALHDERASFLTESGSYSPRNFDPKKEYGDVRFREALANSYNIAAVDLLSRIGLGKFQTFLQSLGLPIQVEKNEAGLSLILGTGESSLLDLTHAYSIFPEGGRLVPVKFFTKVTDESGKVLAVGDQEISKNNQVIDLGAADWIVNALSDKEARWQNYSRGNPLELEFDAAAKTGTSQDFRDNLVVGFSSKFVVGVWAGNADGTPLHTSSGVEGAGPIWQGVMRLVHPIFPPKFQYRSERKKFSVCRHPWEKFPECPEKMTEFLLPEENEKVQSQDSELPRLQISFPGNGDRFHPNSAVVVKWRNASAGTPVEVFVDGQKADPIIPHLDAGMHTLKIRQGSSEDEIRIEVE